MKTIRVSEWEIQKTHGGAPLLAKIGGDFGVAAEIWRSLDGRYGCIVWTNRGRPSGSTEWVSGTFDEAIERADEHILRRMNLDELPVTAEALARLRDQLDEILGDREDYKALRRDHAIMAQALSENEAAAKALGIVEGDDFLLTIAQWAKSYRAPALGTFTSDSFSALCMALKDNPAAADHLGLPPGGDVLRQIAEWAEFYRPPLIAFGQIRLIIREETDPTQVPPAQVDKAAQRIWRLVNRIGTGEKNRPEIREASPDLTEVIASALREYRCAHTVDEQGDGQQLADVLSPGDTIAEGEEELDLLADHLAEAVAPCVRPKDKPHAPAGLKEDLAEALRQHCTENDIELHSYGAELAENAFDDLAEYLAGAVPFPHPKEPHVLDVRHAIANWLNYADDRHDADCTIHGRGMNWANCDCRKARDAIFRVMPWCVVDADDAMDDDLRESIRRVIEADHCGQKIEDYDRDQLAGKIVAIVDRVRPKAEPAIHDCPPLGNQPPGLEEVARKVEAEAAAEDVEAAIMSALGTLSHDNRAAARASYLDEGDFAEFARKIAAALPPQAPALTGDEAAAIRRCLDSAGGDCTIGPRTYGVALFAVDRLTGAPGSPVGPDPRGPRGPRGPAGSKGGEKSGGERPREQWERDTLAEGVVTLKERLDRLEMLTLPALSDAEKAVRKDLDDLVVLYRRLEARVRELGLLTDGQAGATTRDPGA